MTKEKQLRNLLLELVEIDKEIKGKIQELKVLMVKDQDRRREYIV